MIDADYLTKIAYSRRIFNDVVSQAEKDHKEVDRLKKAVQRDYDCLKEVESCMKQLPHGFVEEYRMLLDKVREILYS